MAAALEEGWLGRGAGGSSALAYALLASLALHAALFGALHAPRLPLAPPAPQSAPLVAELLPLRAAPAMSAETAPSRALAQPSKPRPTLERARVRRALAPHRSIVRAEVPRSRPARPVRAAVRETPLVADEGATPPAEAGAQAPQGLETAAGRGSGEARIEPARVAPALDRVAALARYRLALIAEAQRFRRYPRLALDNDWRGKVDVRMAVAASGALASLSVGRGSGYEVLDRQALEMIREAKPRAPIPAPLRGREFSLDIPVIFELREPRA